MVKKSAHISNRNFFHKHQGLLEPGNNKNGFPFLSIISPFWPTLWKYCQSWYQGNVQFRSRKPLICPMLCRRNGKYSLEYTKRCVKKCRSVRKQQKPKCTHAGMQRTQWRKPRARSPCSHYQLWASKMAAARRDNRSRLYRLYPWSLANLSSASA